MKRGYPLLWLNNALESHFPRWLKYLLVRQLFVSESAILFFDQAKSREIIPWEIKFLIDLCLTLKYLLFSLNFLLVTLDIDTWLSQHIEVRGIGLFNKGKSHSKFLRNSASLVAVSKAIIYASIVECEIIVCLKDFHDIATPSKVKT